MFSSINFLFLISLAVTTWIILCYFKQIEQQREEQMTVEIHMDNTFEENIKANTCFGNYDIYLNFLAVFACIYALAKVTSLAENYVTHQVHARLKHAKLLSSKHVEPTTIEEFRIHHLQLTMQIDFLENENAKLEQKVKQLEQTNFMLGGNGFTTISNGANGAVKSQVNNTDTHKHANNNNKTLLNGMPLTHICTGKGRAVGSIGSFGSVVRNRGIIVNSGRDGSGHSDAFEGASIDEGLLKFRDFYIQDRHLELTQQVYVNEGNVKLQIQDFNQEGDNNPQTWEKYLEMQKYAIQKPTTIETPAEVANNVPTVVSTEELQTMKGTEQQRGKRQPHRTRSTLSTTTITRKFRYYYTTSQSHKHVPHTSLALPIKIFYKNLFVCLFCWFL